MIKIMYMYVATLYHMVLSKLSILAAIINSSKFYSIIKLYSLRAFFVVVVFRVKSNRLLLCKEACFWGRKPSIVVYVIMKSDFWFLSIGFFIVTTLICTSPRWQCF